ncbi:MAG: hypothetical protein ACJA0J_001288 [Bdellovibrionota bacterium]|jgi:hypothetical protein
MFAPADTVLSPVVCRPPCGRPYGQTFYLVFSTVVYKPPPSGGLNMANPHKLFLFDGLGAVLSAVFLGLLLPYFNEYIGMSLTHLYVLAGLAVVFAVYSLSCYFFRVEKWRSFMLGIAVVNLSYCGLTIFLLFSNWFTITGWGAAYFMAEIIVIVLLVSLEFQTANRKL